MKVRQATISDLEGIVDLFDAYRVWYRKESNKVDARDFLEARLENGESIIYVVENNGALAGFTQIYPIFSSTRMQRMWLLNDLYVAPEYRGQGLSKQLIDAAKSLCKTTNACGILLETETSNHIGNKLYPRTGFELENNNFYFWTNK